ncbi:MAG: carboxypeptidase regulatory-like domain-containing protein [Nitrospirae bacterium]|nr:carboxypeptidase regulatory-like domain-containing protein [Nitrospirota bacterium]
MIILLNNILKIAVIIIAAFLLPGIQEAPAVETTVFKGQVFDVEGKAVNGAEMFIYNSVDTRRPADFISARTDEDGHFSMTLPPGKYWAVARLRKGEKYGPLMVGDKHSGEPVEIKLGDNEGLELNFTVADIRDAARLMKKTREDYMKVTGRIIDKNGVPVKMYYVIADRKGGDTPLNPLLIEGKSSPLEKGDAGGFEGKFPDFISAWTDDEGRYTIYLPKGKYFIGYADKFPSQGYNVYNELTVESDKDNIDIVIKGKLQR